MGKTSIAWIGDGHGKTVSPLYPYRSFCHNRRPLGLDYLSVFALDLAELMLLQAQLNASVLSALCRQQA